mmetsp:Transcript_5098/g.7042  ORF Transcript_5098/g.7042 Transcript_5098/m.7042 type:complete len:88 (+) Transcript_5098:51-314(+)
MFQSIHNKLKKHKILANNANQMTFNSYFNQQSRRTFFGGGMRPRSDQKYIIALAVILGVVSGYYIFNEPLKQHALEQRKARKEKTAK